MKSSKYSTECWRNMSLKDIPDEVWVDVPNYEEAYQVSNMGRFKSKERIVYAGNPYKMRERILKQFPDSRDEYLTLGFWKNGVRVTINPHRVVGQVFIPNINNLQEINHKSGNKKDNRISELEWSTHSENHKHSIHVLGNRPPSRKGKFNLTAKTTIQMSLEGVHIKEWPSAKEVQRHLGFAASNINACCVGTIKSSKGYTWKYKN